MAKNWIQRGEIVTLAAPYDVSSGDGLLVGNFFGVAMLDAATGEDTEAAMHGVWTLPKTAAQAWTVGAKIYWDDANKECTTTASGNKLIGAATAAADAAAVVGTVRLNGVTVV